MLYNVPNFSFLRRCFPLHFYTPRSILLFDFSSVHSDLLTIHFTFICKQQRSNLSDMEHMCNIGKLGFATSVHLLWLCSLVCVGSARKFGRQFSRSLAQMEVFPLSPYLYVTKDVLRLKMSDLVK